MTTVSSAGPRSELDSEEISLKSIIISKLELASEVLLFKIAGLISILESELVDT